MLIAVIAVQLIIIFIIVNTHPGLKKIQPRYCSKCYREMCVKDTIRSNHIALKKIATSIRNTQTRDQK